MTTQAPDSETPDEKISFSDANTWAYNHLTSRKKYPLLLLGLTLLAIAAAVLLSFVFGDSPMEGFDPYYLGLLAYGAPPAVYFFSSLFLRPAIRLASGKTAAWKDLYSGPRTQSNALGVFLLVAGPLVIVPGILWVIMAVWYVLLSARYGEYSVAVVLFAGGPLLPLLVFPLYYWIACCLVSGDYSIKQSFTYGQFLAGKYYSRTFGLITLLVIITLITQGILTFFLAPMFILSTAHFFHQMREKEGLLPAQPSEDNLSGLPVEEEAPHDPTGEPDLGKAVDHAIDLLLRNKKNLRLLLALSFVAITVGLLIGTLFRLDSPTLNNFHLVAFIVFAAPPLLYVIASLFLRPAIRLARGEKASWKDVYSGTHKWSILLGILVLIVVPLVVVPSFLFSLGYLSFHLYDSFSSFGVVTRGGALIPPLIFPLYYWAGCALVSGDYPIKQSLKYGLKFGVKYYVLTFVLIFTLEVVTVVSLGVPAFFLASIFTLTMAHLFNQMREIEGLLPAQPLENTL